MRDEAEIRGHRRTYIGALPGRIVAGLKKAGSMNPVFVLDEIDKLAADMRGDPAAAMLEVLDPEQNKDFVDHYVEVPVDLSKVMFICTANQLDTISQPLLDRMEMVELSGYTTLEKLAIAKNHLVPKQLGEHGITQGPARARRRRRSRTIIDSYTREAGVRNLEREIAAVCRGVAVKVAEGATQRPRRPRRRSTSCSVRARHVSDVAERTPEVGVVTGLAWTPVGGDILFIEARAYPGKGDVRLTGQMGDVMKESAHGRVLVGARERDAARHRPRQDRRRRDLHIHLPQGAIKKDGPSAGVALDAARSCRCSPSGRSATTSRSPARSTCAATRCRSAASRRRCSRRTAPASRSCSCPSATRRTRSTSRRRSASELDIRFMTKVDDALSVALGEAPPQTRARARDAAADRAGRGSMSERLPS